MDKDLLKMRDNSIQCITNAFNIMDVDDTPAAVHMAIENINSAIGTLKDIISKLEVGEDTSSMKTFDDDVMIELFNYMDRLINDLRHINGIVQNKMPLSQSDIDSACSNVNNVCGGLNNWAFKLQQEYEKARG